MNGRARKTFFLITGIAALGFGLVQLIPLLGAYGHTVPVTAGPYKQALLILCGLVLAVSAGFYFCPLTRQTASGTVGIAAAVLWFTARMLLAYRSPESPWIFRLDRWMPVPLALFGAGAALWTGTLLPKRDLPKNEKTRLILVLLLMFICLQPVLNGGFNWDDAFFSVEAQAMRISGEPIFGRVWREIVEYVRIGRINPFATFHFLVFYFIPDAFAYKLLLLILTLLSGYLFYRFLRLWDKDAGPALTALLAVPLCFQLRLYHDPLNSYYGLMQVMFCELMGALICFVCWLREKKPDCLAVSLLLFAMGLMSYEMFFPLTALFVLTALFHEKKPFPALRASLPHIVLAVLLFGLSMLLRRNITEETAYSGTTFALDLNAILTALRYQLSAAFPLSYRTAGYDTALFGKLIPWHSVFNTSLGQFLSSVQWQDLLACLILVLIINGNADEERGFSPRNVCFGLLLWILPGLVISLSFKYQEDLYPGIAYIPVFFSYFGAALLLREAAALLGKLICPWAMRLICSGIACALLLLTMQDNRAISQRLNEIFLYPRSAGEAALQAGILEEGDAEGRLVVSAVPYSLWEHGWQQEPYQTAFYSLNSRRPVNAIGVRDYIAGLEPETVWITPPRNTKLITYSGDEEGGFAKCGELRGTGKDMEAGRLINPMVTDVFFFVSGKDQDGAVLIYETRDEGTKRLLIEEAWVIRQTDAGTLYKLQDNSPMLFDSIALIGR